MSFIVITINTDNAAFEGYHGPREVARILCNVASKLGNQSDLYDCETESAMDWPLMDYNGNHVGHVECENDPVPESDDE